MSNHFPIQLAANEGSVQRAFKWHNNIQGRTEIELIKNIFEMSVVDENGYLKDPYSQFIHSTRYARWLEDKGRRETWRETVTRCVDFLRTHIQENYGRVCEELHEEIFNAILEQEIMPSMRLMWTAGKAVEKDNIAAYNCAFVAIDNLVAIDEILYVLMNGCGVGFSVEKRYIEQLPTISTTFRECAEEIVVDDSKEGWAKALGFLINRLVHGLVCSWDTSKIRPAGARLKTFGGYASGPRPLISLFEFVVEKFKGAAGRKLRPIEVHDIICKIVDVVIAGGVRRSALISLSDLDDEEMAKAKHGDWRDKTPYRENANNSAVYVKEPTEEEFWKEWKTLQSSGSGERGIFNLYSLRRKIGINGSRDVLLIVGTNPCGEIVLFSLEVCNLTEVIVKATDTPFKIKRKVFLATILGTWQSTLTKFTYLRPEWKKNCEKERLLGVSFTGIYSSEIMYSPNNGAFLDELRNYAIQTNRDEAKKLGINPSAGVTCVKPSGTVSQLVGCSSGLHPWYSEYYMRTVAGSDIDPMTLAMKAIGIPHLTEDGVTRFKFPRKAPENAIVQSQVSAIEHLKLWKHYFKHWTEHNPSVTVTINDDDEWDQVGQWMFAHFREIGSAAFLPKFHTYNQEHLPFREITEKEYIEACNRMPSHYDWSILTQLEKEDHTKGAQTLACIGDSCEVVDTV